MAANFLQSTPQLTRLGERFPTLNQDDVSTLSPSRSREFWNSRSLCNIRCLSEEHDELNARSSSAHSRAKCSQILGRRLFVVRNCPNQFRPSRPNGEYQRHHR